MPISKILFSLLLLSATISLVALWAHLSTWYLWHLLPDGELKLALNYTHPASHLLDNFLAPTLPDVAPTIKNVRRFAYVQSTNSSTIALVPSNPFLFRDRHHIIQQLTDYGWSTSNYGLVILGRKGETTPLTSIQPAAINTFSKLISLRHPYKPTIIAQTTDQTLPMLSQNLALVGVMTTGEGEIKVVIAPDLFSLPDFSIVGPPSPNQTDYLAANLPGTTIQSVAGQFSQSWNDIFYQKLNFNQTKPAIFSFLTTQQTISLTLTQDNASLAIFGQPELLAAAAHQWIQDEETYSRPTKQAFRLPDKTLGYELVPGEPQPVLSPPDQSGCRSPLHDNVSLWLCQGKLGVSIGTSLAAAQQELTNLSTNTRQLSIGSTYLEQLDLSPINLLQSLTYYNSGPYTIITGQLK